MIKAVIFDMDGMMVDTEPLQSLAFERVIYEYGKSPIFCENGLVQIVGIREEDNWDLLKQKHLIDESIEVLGQKRKVYYRSILHDRIFPMPGLFYLLSLFEQKGLKMAVGSSSKFEYIKLTISSLGIEKFFNVTVSGEEVEHGKPSPDIFLLAAQRMGLMPASCLVLEDAETGVAAARAAGMKVIAVPSVYTKNQDFSNASRIANSMTEIDDKMLDYLEVL